MQQMLEAAIGQQQRSLLQRRRALAMQEPLHAAALLTYPYAMLLPYVTAPSVLAADSVSSTCAISNETPAKLLFLSDGFRPPLPKPEASLPAALSFAFGVLNSKPIKRAELLARIGAHLRMKADATWVNSLVNGAMKDDAEAMKILKSILPETIIHRIQVLVDGCKAEWGLQIVGVSSIGICMFWGPVLGGCKLKQASRL